MSGLAICVDGVQDDELITAATPWIGRFDRIEVWCAYGDIAERELAHVRERHGRPRADPHRPPPPPHGQHRPPPPHEQNQPPLMQGPLPPPHHDNLDEEQADAIAERAVALLRARNVTVQARVLGGWDPGHAISDASNPDVALFLAAGHGGGSGPKSIGHVARFIIDHAVGPVIVVRLGAAD